MPRDRRDAGRPKKKKLIEQRKKEQTSSLIYEVEKKRKIVIADRMNVSGAIRGQSAQCKVILEWTLKK